MGLMTSLCRAMRPVISVRAARCGVTEAAPPPPPTRTAVPVSRRYSRTRSSTTDFT